MKRALDILVAMVGLTVLSPVFVAVAIVIWLQDWHSPLYRAPRAGRGELPFTMVKFRSMVIRADRSGVDSTAGDDPRITVVGRTLRRLKLDELPQLWNVLKGDMSLVGPRPNVLRETASYTAEEKHLLDVRPGITDLASIAFADEGDILHGASDPDLRYNQIIRPWKSRLGLLYVAASKTLWRDIHIMYLTLLAAFDRPRALEGVSKMVLAMGGTPDLAAIAARRTPLKPAPPPGATEIVSCR